MADEVIKKCVEDIWATYDTDGNGCLDKNETKAFVKATLVESGEDGAPQEFSEEDFD